MSYVLVPSGLEYTHTIIMRLDQLVEVMRSPRTSLPMHKKIGLEQRVVDSVHSANAARIRVLLCTMGEGVACILDPTTNNVEHNCEDVLDYASKCRLLGRRRE